MASNFHLEKNENLLFSFLIVNYKSAGLTITCIDSIKSWCSGHRFEIIVVDNNSGPNQLDKIKNAHSDIICIQNKENAGFGQGNNIAATFAKGDIFVLINPDVELTSDVLHEFSNIFSQKTSKVILGGRLLSKDHSATTSFGNFPSILHELIYLFSLQRISWRLEQKFSLGLSIPERSTQPLLVDYVSGALCAIPREVFMKTQGFDKEIFLYFEETLLMYKHKQDGGSTLVIPSATAIHTGSATTGEDSELKLFHMELGRKIFYKYMYGKIGLTAIALIRSLALIKALIIRRNIKHIKPISVWYSKL